MIYEADNIKDRSSAILRVEESVTVPGSDGEMTVLSHHTPLFICA